MKKLFENWEKFVNEASMADVRVGMPVRQDRVRELRGNMDPLSKEELEALLPGGSIADPMNPRAAGPDDLMPLGKKDGFAYYKAVSGARWGQVPIKQKSGEGSMAQGQLKRISELANMISEEFDDSTDLEEWVESKITKALDYLSSVQNYMRGKADEKAAEEILATRMGSYRGTTLPGGKKIK